MFAPVSKGQPGEFRVKDNVMLTIVALLSIVLSTLHITDDVMNQGGMPPKDVVSILVIIVVFLYGTTLLMGRLSGFALILLGSLGAAAMPFVHGASMAQARHGYFFIFTLLALGVTGTFGAILAVRGLWGLRARRGRAGSF
jgi:hypothetical protein